MSWRVSLLKCVKEKAGHGKEQVLDVYYGSVQSGLVCPLVAEGDCLPWSFWITEPPKP